MVQVFLGDEKDSHPPSLCIVPLQILKKSSTFGFLFHNENQIWYTGKYFCQNTQTYISFDMEMFQCVCKMMQMIVDQNVQYEKIFHTPQGIACFLNETTQRYPQNIFDQLCSKLQVKDWKITPEIHHRLTQFRRIVEFLGFDILMCMWEDVMKNLFFKNPFFHNFMNEMVSCNQIPPEIYSDPQKRTEYLIENRNKNRF